MFYLQKLYLFSTYILLILYQSSPYQWILSPLQTYSLRLLNVLFTTRKCTLYNAQTYTLILVSAKNAEGMKEHRQAVKCKARNPC